MCIAGRFRSPVRAARGPIWFSPCSAVIAHGSGGISTLDVLEDVKLRTPSLSARSYRGALCNSRPRESLRTAPALCDACDTRRGLRAAVWCAIVAAGRTDFAQEANILDLILTHCDTRSAASRPTSFHFVYRYLFQIRSVPDAL